jgi:hypothetical protein
MFDSQTTGASWLTEEMNVLFFWHKYVLWKCAVFSFDYPWI